MNEIPNEIIRRYAKKKGLTLSQSEKKFEKLQFFLDDAAKSKQTPTLEVDELWHEFILDTKYYSDYCFSRHKKFIHHIPNSVSDCDSGKCSSGISPRMSECSSDCSSIHDSGSV